jgi:hypothetical protein
MHGLFLVRERQRACSSWHGAGAALLLMVALLPGCSDVALPSEEMPASGAYPWYNDLVANHLKKTFTNRASYDAFAISAFRWVHSLNGWAWMTCVRFEDRVLRLERDRIWSAVQPVYRPAFPRAESCRPIRRRAGTDQENLLRTTSNLLRAHPPGDRTQ